MNPRALPPHPPPATEALPLARAPATAGATPLPSDTLLQGRTSIEISHNGAVYRLQSTRQGKLILTK